MRTLELQLEQNRLAHRRNLVEIDYQVTRLTRSIERQRDLAAKELVSKSTLDELQDELTYYERRRAVTLESQATDARLQEEQLRHALVRAMIGAAKADGRIDPEERQRIQAQIEALGLSGEMRDFVRDELAAPLDLDAIVAPAVCEETAAEIYAASLMAIDRTRAAEQAYLTLLAARLELAPGLVDHLNANVDAAKTLA